MFLTGVRKTSAACPYKEGWYGGQMDLGRQKILRKPWQDDNSILSNESKPHVFSLGEGGLSSDASDVDNSPMAHSCHRSHLSFEVTERVENH